MEDASSNLPQSRRLAPLSPGRMLERCDGFGAGLMVRSSTYQKVNTSIVDLHVIN